MKFTWVCVAPVLRAFDVTSFEMRMKWHSWIIEIYKTNGTLFDLDDDD